MTSLPAGKILTTGIGSLPHVQRDAALEFSFRHSLPFLPQIPLRNPNEFMISQALEGLPGAEFESGGTVLLHSISASVETEFERKLYRCLGDPLSTELEPSPQFSTLWQPFLFECDSRKIKHAKIQLAGPITTNWAVRVATETTPESTAKHLISKLVFARALSMARRLKQQGIQPVVFIDEPGLYVCTPDRPDHLVAFQELTFLFQSLKNEGALTGLHCCSDADWATILGISALDILSFDARLSLDSLVALDSASGKSSQIRHFQDRGGILALGLSRHPEQSEELRLILSKLHQPKTFIVTAPCGLALASIEESEATLDQLNQSVQLNSDKSLGKFA